MRKILAVEGYMFQMRLALLCVLATLLTASLPEPLKAVHRQNETCGTLTQWVNAHLRSEAEAALQVGDWATAETKLQEFIACNGPKLVDSGIAHGFWNDLRCITLRILPRRGNRYCATPAQPSSRANGVATGLINGEVIGTIYSGQPLVGCLGCFELSPTFISESGLGQVELSPIDENAYKATVLFGLDYSPLVNSPGSDRPLVELNQSSYFLYVEPDFDPHSLGIKEAEYLGILTELD